MSEFLDIAFSFPAVVFTVSTIFFLGFWVISTLIGAGMDSLDDLDFDFDADVDADVSVDTDTDIDLDGEGAGGILRGALEFLGITGMPLLLAINLISLFAWAIAMTAMVILGGADNSISAMLGIPVLVGSFLLGGFLTGRIAKRFAHVFVPTLAMRRRQLVGTVCTIKTGKVTADFGQAEVHDDEGSSLIVQVRCAKENDLASGDRALIFDLDTERGVFQVSPDRSLAS